MLKIAVFLMMTGFLGEGAAEVSWEETLPRESTESTPFAPRYRACDGMDDPPPLPLDASLEESFKKEIKRRAISLVDERRKDTVFVRGCFQGDSDLTCEGIPQATRTLVASFWKEMRVSLALSYPNPTEMRTLGHKINHFSPVPALSEEERGEVESRRVRFVEEKEGIGQGDPFAKSRLANSRSSKDLQRISQQRYFKILVSLPLMGYVQSSTPSDDEMVAGHRKLEGQLEELLKEIDESSWALPLSFPSLVEELLKEHPTYCPVAEALTLKAERMENVGSGIWLGVAIGAAIPCFMSGPMGWTICLAGGVSLGLYGYLEALEKVDLSQRRVLVEEGHLDELNANEREAFMEGLFLPLSAWGATATSIKGAFGFGKNVVGPVSVRGLHGEKNFDMKLNLQRQEAPPQGGSRLWEERTPAPAIVEGKQVSWESAASVRQVREVLPGKSVAAENAVPVDSLSIHEIIENEHVDVVKAVKRYIAEGGDVDAVDGEGRTLLIKMVENKNHILARHLVESGAGVNVREPLTGRTALHIAVGKHSNETVLTLLRHRADDALVDGNGEIPIMLAVRVRNNKALGIFLERRGIDIDAVDPHNGLTLLQQAAKNDNREAARIFMDKGANPDIGDAVNGSTALYMASEKGEFDMVRFLVHRGANVNARNNNGDSPIKQAILNKDSRLMKFFLEMRANPNIRDGEGSTPLHTAVSVGHRESVQMLLAKGADPSIANQSGETAFDLAIANRNVEDVKMIFGKMVDIGRNNSQRRDWSKPSKDVIRLFSEKRE